MEKCPYYRDTRFRIKHEDPSQNYTVGEPVCKHPEVPKKRDSLGSAHGVHCEGDVTKCLLQGSDSPSH